MLLFINDLTERVFYKPEHSFFTRRLPFPSAIRLSDRAEDFGMMDYVVVIDKVYYVFRINSVFYNVVSHFRS